MNSLTMMKKPSGFLPLAMSVAAIALLLGHIAIFGIVRQADEGASARIFQLLMVAQLPIMAYFAVKWLPQNPRQTLLILALQVGAALAVLAPVFLLDF